MTTDTDALLATVRAALEYVPPSDPYEAPANAALNSLAAELTWHKNESQAAAKAYKTCEAELERVRQETHVQDKTIARLGRDLERVKAERDAARKGNADMVDDMDANWRNWRAAEARLDKALSALREHEHTTQTEIALQVGEANCPVCDALAALEEALA